MKLFHVLVCCASMSTLASGEEASSLSPAAASKKPASISRLAVEANSRFAFDLYEKIRDGQSGNLFFSPYSISVALAMLAEGARGATADELGQALRFDSALHRADAAQPWELDRIRDSHRDLASRLRTEDTPEITEIRVQIASIEKKLQLVRAARLVANATGNRERRRELWKEERTFVAELNPLLQKVDQYELTVANGLWVKEQYKLNSAFVAALNASYDAQVSAVDFNAPVETAKRINSWVSRVTKEEIKGVVDPKNLSPLTRLILTNAVYFNGNWAVPFRSGSTKARDFFVAGEAVEVPMMRQRNLKIGRYAAISGDGSVFDTPAMAAVDGSDETYPDDAGFVLAELPYKGGDVTMVVLVPRSIDGLKDLEERIDAEKLNSWLGALKQRKMHVDLPKFQFRSELGLKDILKSLGVQQAFTNAADLSGIPASRSKDLFVSAVHHKAVVTVNEEGTKAAAVTSIEVTAKAAAPAARRPFTPVVKADRPFLFAIRDRRTGALLFLGRVHDPRS